MKCFSSKWVAGFCLILRLGFSHKKMHINICLKDFHYASVTYILHVPVLFPVQMKKLRESYLLKRTQRKRVREENSEKDDKEKEGASNKRSKLSSTSKEDDDSVKTKMLDTDGSKLQGVVTKVEDDKSKLGEQEQDGQEDEMEESEEEDPEEEPIEEDEDEIEGGSDGNQEEGQSEDEKMGNELLDSAPGKASGKDVSIPPCFC